eukprot:TRINITY_DN3500_c0_g2_i2.p1 TRINITY_DN3500_c0_g2~~TRINITY_DN3500_c0_g2_i2.p1  ORF type:complete len:902 (-),score=223.53 TRINITY_DN3500_c0_g2_i2:583-3288(-)
MMNSFGDGEHFAEERAGSEIQLGSRLPPQSSVSFGRFESETLHWDKWSSFSQNKYLEEAEKFSTPGSVVQKKAFFEEFFRKKALEQQLAQAAAAAEATPNSTCFRSSRHSEDLQESSENDANEDLSEVEGFHVGSHMTHTQQTPLPVADGNSGLEAAEVEENEHLDSLMFNVEDERVASFITQSVLKMVSDDSQPVSALDSNTHVHENHHQYMTETHLECGEDKSPSMEIHCHASRGSQENGDRPFPSMEVQCHESQSLEEHGDKSLSSMEISCQESQTLEENGDKSFNLQGSDVTVEEVEETSSNSAFSDSHQRLQLQASRENNLSSSIDAKDKNRCKALPGKQKDLTEKNHQRMLSAKRSSNVAKPRPSRSVAAPIADKTMNSQGKSLRSATKDPASKLKISAGDIIKPKLPQSTTGTKSLNPVDKVSSTSRVSVEKKLSKPISNASTKPTSSKAEAVTKRTLKTPKLSTHENDIRQPHKETLSNTRKLDEKKGSKQVDLNASARFVRSVNESKLDCKTSRTGFASRTIERAEKRKEFYMRLEEEKNAKEAEMNEIQAKTQEKKMAEIRQLRKSLNFKATPMPSFYNEAQLPKTEGKKTSVNQTPSICGRSAVPARKSASHVPDFVGSSKVSHTTVSGREHITNVKLESHNKLPAKGGQGSMDGRNNTLKNVPKDRRLPVSASKALKAKSASHPNLKSEDGNTDNVKNSKVETSDIGFKLEKDDSEGNPITDEQRTTCNSCSMDSPTQDDVVMNVESLNLIEDSCTHAEKCDANAYVNNDGDKGTMDSNLLSNNIEHNVNYSCKSGERKEKSLHLKSEGLKTKDSHGNNSRSSAHRAHQPENSGQDNKYKISKSPKNGQQKTSKASGSTKHETDKNSSLKQNIKTSPGLSCISTDIAVA